VGYLHREVLDCGAAAAVGAWRRGFGTAQICAADKRRRPLAVIAGGAKPLPGSELGVLGIHGVGASRVLVDATQNFEDSMSGM
jgi:hypothetical protein